MHKRLFSFFIIVLCLSCHKDKVVYLKTIESKPSYERYFVTLWDMREQSQLLIPTGQGDFLYDVDWDGDGVFDDFNFKGDALHTYNAPGIYKVSIRGTFSHMRFNTKEECDAKYDNKDMLLLCNKNTLLSVVQWGDQNWISMDNMFMNAEKLKYVPEQLPKFKRPISMKNMFYNASSFNQNISSWNVSNVDNMSAMFSFAENFNQDINSWDVSNVKDMYSMFEGATSFDQNISSWDIDPSYYE